MTTATDLGTACAARFRDPNHRVVDATTWLAYINEVYSEVNTKSPLWPWLESTEQSVTVLANTRGIALAANVFQVNWAYDSTDDYRLIPQEGRGDQWHQDHLRSEVGQPVTYRIRGNVIELFPTPQVDTVVKYEAVLIPAALGGSDSPAWGTTYDDLLINGALSKAYLDDGNAQWFSTHDTIFNRRLTEMLNFFLAFRTETYVPIRDTFWS